MDARVLVALSVCTVVVQAVAAIIALRLIPVSGGRWAWRLLASAMAVMAARRGYSLWLALAHGYRLSPVEEGLALAVSLLLLAGVAAIAPIFRSLRVNEARLLLVSDRLALSERRYRLLFEKMLNGFALLEVSRSDQEYAVTRVAEANTSFEKLLGAPPQGLAGKTLTEAFPRSGRALAKLVSTALASEGATRTSLYVADIGSFADTIVYRVEENAAALILSVVADERTLGVARSYFTSVTAHQLRTPLTKLELALAVLRDGGDPSLAPALAALTSSRDELYRIMEETTLFTRLLSMKSSLHLVPTPVAPLLESVVAEVRGEAAKEGRQVTITFSPPDAPAEAVLPLDAELFYYALTHLLSNGIKYTHDGGRVSATVAAPEGAIVVAVGDEGIGMDEATLRMLFTPYFSYEEVLRYTSGEYGFKAGGIGLGLILVRMIVELHGGSVAVASPGPNRGTTVTLTFPVRASDAPRRNADAPTSPTG